MNKEAGLSPELREFVHREIGPIWWLKEELSKETTLMECLGIDGDDALDFFEAFEKEFKVDLSSLDLSKHFNPEGSDPFGIIAIWHWIRGKGNNPFTKASSIRDLTLEDLDRAILHGKWIE